MELFQFVLGLGNRKLHDWLNFSDARMTLTPTPLRSQIRNSGLSNFAKLSGWAFFKRLTTIYMVLKSSGYVEGNLFLNCWITFAMWTFFLYWIVHQKLTFPDFLLANVQTIRDVVEFVCLAKDHFFWRKHSRIFLCLM